MAEPLKQPTIVVPGHPGHPGQRGQLHFLSVFPALPVYHLRFILPVNTFGHGIIIRVTRAAR